MNKKGIVTFIFLFAGLGFISSMMTSEATKPYTTKPEDCKNGCIVSNKCLSYGQRFYINETRYYCNPDKSTSEQKELGEYCEKDYECISNFCGKNKCIFIEEKEKNEKENWWKRFIEKFFKLDPL